MAPGTAASEPVGMSVEKVQVAVVGAGPAGAMTALHLGEAGVEVLLIDRHSFPREKVCGDGLIPDAQRALARAGLLDVVVSKGCCFERTTVFSPGRIEADVRGRFITLPRKRLDHILVREACARGARLIQDKVETIALGPQRAELRLSDRGPISADYVIVATGANVSLLNKIGAVDDPAPSAIAYRQYFTATRPLDRLVVSYDRTILPGYAWIFPIGERLLNVGLGFERTSAIRPREALARFMNEFPLLREQLGELKAVSRLRGSSLRYGLTGTRPVTSRRVLAVGDAVGATFPFTGEGIGKALETGEIAASVVRETLESGRPEEIDRYRMRIDALREKYVGYHIANRWLSRAWLADLVLSRIKRSPTLTQHVEDLLHERVDPRRIFSAGGLLRSLVQ